MAVVAEGPELVLKTLLEELRQGPVGSSVSQVDTTWKEAQGDFTTFEVKF